MGVTVPRTPDSVPESRSPKVDVGNGEHPRFSSVSPDRDMIPFTR